jgi:membrane protein YfhO
LYEEKLIAQRKDKRCDYFPISLLIGLIFLFFGKIIITGQTLFGMDFIHQFYPWKKFIYDHLWSHGSLPFWNPYLFSGTPFITNIQASMFYPPGFIYYLIPTELAYTYSTIAHCILGNIFMYTFMRAILVSRAGSCISAVIFMFNGYFMGHLYAGHLSFVQNYIWIPLIFHLLYLFVQKMRFRYAVICGLILGIQILGGFPQIAFYTILCSMGFGLFNGIVFLKNHIYRDALKLGFGLILLLCVGFALAAIQILPTMEFTGLSTRAGGISYAFATYESLHPKELLAFLVPDIFGSAVDHTYWRSKEVWHFWESCGYVGVLPLFLVFMKLKSSSIRSLRIFFIILIVFSLFLALGKYNPIYPIIYRLPGFNSFRIPAQIIFLYVFGIAVISGIGFHQMQEETWHLNRGFSLFFVLAGALLVIFLIGVNFFPFQFFFQLFRTFSEGPVTHASMTSLYERISICTERGVLLFFGSFLLIMLRKQKKLNVWSFSVLGSAIVLMDLYLFGAPFIKTNGFITSPNKQNIVSQLNGNPANGRVVTISHLFKANEGLRYKFPSVLGYDPLILRRYVSFTQASQNYPLDDRVVNLAYINVPGEKLIRMLNVRQMVLGGHFQPLENELPYANIVNNAVIKQNDEALPFIKSDRFTPQNMVVFDPEYSSYLFPKDQSEKFKASCTILDYHNENMRIKTSSNHPGYLVLSEIFYPGWRVTVDGKKGPLLRGNYMFRVVPIEKGEHTVLLRFVSRPFRIGAVISLITLTCSLWFVLRRRKREPISDAS